MKEIKIRDRIIIGDNNPVYIIAEMSANHAGSLERAKDIIFAAREAGADCIKIQTYTPDTLTIDCDNEYFRVKSGTWENQNLYDLYGQAFTPWDWQPQLMETARLAGIDFLSTPFDKTAVDFLENMGMDFYKIASFEIVDIPLIEYVASKGKPMIISTGLASLAEIMEAKEAALRKGNAQIAFLKCSSAYPADPGEMNLRTIADLIQKLQVPVGLSDHSMGNTSAVLSVALGAKVIEKHFCMNREIKNPDASFSMTPHEFKEMVQSVRLAEKALGKVAYGAQAQEKDSIVFRRSLFAVQDIKKGEMLTEQNMRSIRPGYGEKPKYYNELLGKKINQDIKRGMPLYMEMIRNN